MSTAPLPPAAAPWQLLDVLEQLPRDVLRESLWRHLTVRAGPPGRALGAHDTTTGRPFRLVCRCTLQLADQLTQRLLLTAPRGAGRHAVQSAQAAFLARQEGVTNLVLHEGVQPAAEVDAAEVFIIKTLLRGGATCRRLRCLEIVSPSSRACSDAAGEALQLCCPRLQALKVTVNKVGPPAAFFSPLAHCPALVKVAVIGNAADFQISCVLRGLAALPHLRELCLKGRLDYRDLALLTALKSVRELRAEWLTVTAPPNKAGMVTANALGRALGGMAHLTALEVPRCAGGSLEAMNAVVAQLGGLQGLTALVFGTTTACSLTLPAAFDAVLWLTALVRLSCPAACQKLTAVGAAGLPRLQHLRITGNVSAASLRATLCPLLPLPQLRVFECTYSGWDAHTAATPLAECALLEQVNLQFNPFHTSSADTFW